MQPPEIMALGLTPDISPREKSYKNLQVSTMEKVRSQSSFDSRKLAGIIY